MQPSWPAQTDFSCWQLQGVGCDAAARDGAEAVQAGLSRFLDLVQSAAAEGSIQVKAWAPGPAAVAMSLRCHASAPHSIVSAWEGGSRTPLRQGSSKNRLLQLRGSLAERLLSLSGCLSGLPVAIQVQLTALCVRGLGPCCGGNRLGAVLSSLCCSCDCAEEPAQIWVALHSPDEKAVLPHRSTLTSPQQLISAGVLACVAQQQRHA